MQNDGISKVIMKVDLGTVKDIKARESEAAPPEPDGFDDGDDELRAEPGRDCAEV